MPAPYPYGATVTVWRASVVVDRDNNETPGPFVEIAELVGCGIAPRESVEDNDARAAVVIGVTVYAPPSVDVQPGDRCEIAGRLYEVDGLPADWAHPMTGWTPGTVIQLTAVEG